MSKKIEGLCLEIQALTKDGHERLSILDLEGACVLFEKAKKLALTLDEGFTLRACYFNLGACYVAQGEAQKGLEVLLKALPPEKDIDGVENYADLHYNLGIAYDAVGKHKEALECYETALRDYQKNENPTGPVLEMMAETLVKMAVDCSNLGDIPKASSCYSEAAEIYSKLGDQANQVLTLCSKVTLLAELGDSQAYETLLPTLKHLCQNIEDTQLQAKILNDIGLVYNAERSFEKAAQYFEHALSLVPQEDIKLKAVLHQNLGATYNQMKHYEKAITSHSKAIKIIDEMDIKHTKTQVLCNLGFAYSQLGELGKASETFQSAVENAKEHGDKNGQLQGIEGYAAICFLQGDYEKAVVQYKVALALLASIGTIDSVTGDRIVSKLSDALECHVMHSRGVKQNHSQNSKEVTPSLSRQDSRESQDSKVVRRVGKGRPGRGRHRLVARGIDGSQTESETESGSDSSDSSVSSNDSGSSSERRRMPAVPHWGHDKKINKMSVDSQQSTSVDRTPANHSDQRKSEDDLYEEPSDVLSRVASPSTLSDTSNMSRAHKEALLAEYSQYNPPLPPTPKSEQNKNTSAMCLIQ